MLTIESLPSPFVSHYSTVVCDALYYASLERRVIPLQGKKPFLERWPERATCDRDQIIRWFERWPDMNLGMVTGGGIIAVDIDPRNGGVGSLRKLIRGKEWPTTATALTGSGGNHYLFRTGPGVRVGNITNLKPGIDIKGEGGQIVVEPSVHPKTKRDYVWLRTLHQGIAAAPGWLMRLLTKYEKPRPVPTIGEALKSAELTRDGNPDVLLAEAIARFRIQARGQRNKQMTRLTASLLGRGFRAELTQAVVAEWWRHYFLAGVIATSPTEASRKITACMKSILRSPKFRKGVGRDHRAELQKIVLSPRQELVLDSIVTPTGLAMPNPYSNRVTSYPKLCSKRYERQFVEALIVYFTYKIVVLGESPLKATNTQLEWILEDRYGTRLDNSQFERLAERYITRLNKPASRHELAIQTVKGKKRQASEYELTGLSGYMPPEGPECPSRPGTNAVGTFDHPIV